MRIKLVLILKGVGRIKRFAGRNYACYFLVLVLKGIIRIEIFLGRYYYLLLFCFDIKVYRTS